MAEAGSFLQELDDAIARGSEESRLKALWYATDLLVPGRYTEDQIWIFGEVMGRLAEEIDVTARAQLARRLARNDNAPFSLIIKLAFHDLISVAGPILRESERLDVRALVANARSKSQQHLLAISKRTFISDAVTDVLVTRGNQEVVASAAANHGARFSELGFLHLLKRSEGDSALAEHLGYRADIPRHVFQQLIAKASGDLKKKLEKEQPGNRLPAGATDITVALHAKFGPASKCYLDAKRIVGVLHRYGKLNENKILDYAQSHKFHEATVALALLCVLPVDVVERALLDKNRELVLILCKALNLSWPTTSSLLFLGAADYRMTLRELDGLRNGFARLGVETSKKVLKFYQSRKEAAAASCDLAG